ncbi:hypothetical protein [Streptomyces sp. NPDC046727]|uniref:hypothetical protein n=1 Tax=Streptomyces sp. NPDC046727 TaxID=3155373 RepID=UPI0033E546B1
MATLDITLSPYVQAAVSGETTLHLSGPLAGSASVDVYVMLPFLTLPWPLIVWLMRTPRVGGVAVRTGSRCVPREPWSSAPTCWTIPPPHAARCCVASTDCAA